MKVILLQDVKSLGKKDQIVEVNDGYARNFILPKKLGVEASSGNLNTLKLQKANEAKVAAENLAKAKEFAEELSKLTVVVKMKAGEGGRAFGSVSSKEIAEEAKKQHGVDIDKKKIFEKQLSRIAKGEYSAPLFVITYPLYSAGILEIYEYNELRQNFYRTLDDKIEIIGVSSSKEGARQVLCDILEDHLSEEGVLMWPSC